MYRVCKLLAGVVFIFLMLTGCGKNPSEAGLELLQSGNYEAAIEEFEKAVEKEINAADAYRGIGIAKWEMNDYEGARAAFQSALKNEAVPTATLYNFLGTCELRLENYNKALNYYRVGMTKECSKEMMQEMRFNEILCFEKLNEWASAKVKLDEYIADYPGDKRAAKEAEFLETR